MQKRCDLGAFAPDAVKIISSEGGIVIHFGKSEKIVFTVNEGN